MSVKETKTSDTSIAYLIYYYVCVCVCVRERERGREVQAFMCAYVCVYLCVGKRKRESLRGREREREIHNTPIAQLVELLLCVRVRVCVCVCSCVCMRKRLLSCVLRSFYSAHIVQGIPACA